MASPVAETVVASAAVAPKAQQLRDLDNTAMLLGCVTPAVRGVACSSSAEMSAALAPTNDSTTVGNHHQQLCPVAFGADPTFTTAAALAAVVAVGLASLSSYHGTIFCIGMLLLMYVFRAVLGGGRSVAASLIQSSFRQYTASKAVCAAEQGVADNQWHAAARIQHAAYVHTSGARG